MKIKKLIITIILSLVLIVGGILTYHFLTQDSSTELDEMDLEHKKSAEDSADDIFKGFEDEN